MLPGDGGILKMTTARYYLPDGRSLDRNSNRVGASIRLRLPVDLGPEEYSEIVERRREFEPIGGPGEDASFDDPAWIRDSMKDPTRRRPRPSGQARRRGLPQ